MKYLRFLIFFHALGLSATTVVAIWTEHKVTIVADSKITMTGENGAFVGTGTGCKVHVVRDLIFANAGLLQNETVDVIAAIKQMRELRDQDTGKPLPDMGPIIGAQSAVQKALAARKADYDPLIHVGLILATREEGLPTLTRVEWIPRLPGELPGDEKPWNRQFAFGSRRSKYPEGRREAVNPDRIVEIIGMRNAIDKYKQETSEAEWKDRTEWKDPDIVRFGKKLVMLEAGDPMDSTLVGGPLTVATLDKDGPRWIERGVCKE